MLFETDSDRLKSNTIASLGYVRGFAILNHINIKICFFFNLFQILHLKYYRITKQTNIKHDHITLHTNFRKLLYDSACVMSYYYSLTYIESAKAKRICSVHQLLETIPTRNKNRFYLNDYFKKKKVY